MLWSGCQLRYHFVIYSLLHVTHLTQDAREGTAKGKDRDIIWVDCCEHPLRMLTESHSNFVD